MLLDLSDQLKDVNEIGVVPANEEVRLRIVRVTRGVDKNDCEYLLLMLEPVDFPSASEFTQFIHIPGNPKLTPRQNERAKRQMRDLLVATGLDPLKPFDPEDDLAGLEFWAIVGVRDDANYGPQNYIKKMLTR